VVHIVRLGSLHLPDYLDFAALDHSQQLLLDAVRTNDAAAARVAIETIGTIKVPLEFTEDAQQPVPVTSEG
jgi:hypothetical protein